MGSASGFFEVLWRVCILSGFPMHNIICDIMILMLFMGCQIGVRLCSCADTYELGGPSWLCKICSTCASWIRSRLSTVIVSYPKWSLIFKMQQWMHSAWNEAVLLHITFKYILEDATHGVMFLWVQRLWSDLMVVWFYVLAFAAHFSV